MTRYFLIVLLFVPQLASAQSGAWDTRFAPHGFSVVERGQRRVNHATVYEGEVYVSGDIFSNGTTPMFHYARHRNGVWEAITGEPPFRDVRAIALYEGQVVGCGTASSWVPDGPYLWNGLGWEVMGEGIVSLDGPYINASVTYNGELIIGGMFDASSGGESFEGIARWDGTNWKGLGAGVSGVVLSLLIRDGDLYVGGYIQSAGGVPVSNLARWDGTSWSSVSAVNELTGEVEQGIGSTWSTYVFALAEHDGKLAIGGDFDAVGSQPAANIAFYDDRTASPVWEVYEPDATPGAVLALSSYGGALYAGGDPGMVPGAAGPGTFGRLGPQGWEEIAGAPDNTITTLLPHGSTLGLGGAFERAGDMACAGWVRFDGDNYIQEQNQGGLGLSGEVQRLVHYLDDMVAVGNFQSAGALAVGGLARWNGNEWSAFPGGGTSGAVFDAFVVGDSIYVCGEFSDFAGESAQNVAWFDGSQWHMVDAPEGATPRAIAFHEGSLYIGGCCYLNPQNGQYHSGFLMRHSGSGWEPVDLSVRVSDLTVYKGALLVAGGAPQSSSLAWFGELEGSSLVERFTYVQDGSTSFIRMVEAHGLVYVLGDFMKIWDGYTIYEYERPALWEELPGTDGTGMGNILDLTFVGSRAYVATGGYYNGFTVWTWDGAGPLWTPVDRGTHSTAWAILNYQGSAYVAGAFRLVGIPRSQHRIGGNPVASAGIARWDTWETETAAPPSATPLVLQQNTPNPFNPSTLIEFEIPAGGRNTDLRVYDLRGRVVRHLWSGFHPEGRGTVKWDGRDDAGQAAASGAYLYVLNAGDLTQVRKMMLVR